MIKLLKQMFCRVLYPEWKKISLKNRFEMLITDIRFRLFGWFSIPLQNFLYRRKIYWHDFFVGQCTRGFECCRHKIPDEYIPLIQQLVRAREEQIPTVYYTKER